MTSRHILSRWERVAPMLRTASSRNRNTARFGATSMWFIMLCLADAPRTSQSVADKMHLSRASVYPMIQYLAQNGLIVSTGFHLGDGTSGSAQKVWQATPKLYDVLGLKPALNTLPNQEAAA